MPRPSFQSVARREGGSRRSLRARLELGSGVATTGLTATLLGGVLALQLFMIGSYVGALHEPKAREVPVAVVGPPPVSGRLAATLGGSDALETTVLPDLAAARRAIDEREIYGAIVPGARGDRLFVAEAASAAVAELLPAALRRAEPPGRRLTVEDLKPLPSDDPRGISPFYLVVGWLVGGYLGATILGLARGGIARDRRLALARLATLAAYAIASGLLGALIVQQLVGVLGGSFVALAAAGALIVFATGAATAALQSLLGVVGTALAILLFVALGNPSSGGPLANELLMPEPWGAVGPLLPPGAGTTLVRNLAYFDGNAVAGSVWVLAAYAVAGSALVLALARRRAAGGAQCEPAAVAGTAAAA